VTGGSRGLGRAIAAVFGDAGAKVVLVARGQQQLEQAAAELSRLGHEVQAVAADITSQADVDRLFETVVEQHGGIDVLVNNAGRSDRGLAHETTPETFRELMELNLVALARCTRAAVPELLKRQGHLVNVSSLAGKSAARYLGAYPASKFAVSAYTQQLRLELSPQGLHVLLVCPGPIVRDELPDYVAETSDDLPPEARRPGGGVKTRAIDPELVAQRIVRACEQRRAELIIPRSARLLFTLMQLSPRLADYLVRLTTS